MIIVSPLLLILLMFRVIVTLIKVKLCTDLLQHITEILMMNGFVLELRTLIDN